MKNQLRGLISRPITQTFFMQLLKLCHAGLNYGGGHSPADSGEIGAIEFVLQSAEPSRRITLFDVGANDGEYLQQALRILGTRARIYSFEPQAACYERLHARFSGDSRVEVVKAAAGSVAGAAELFSEGAGDSTASLHRNAIHGQAVAETVQVITVDEFSIEQAVEQIDLLKIDTEGHELEVLLGASATIAAGRVAFIQFEFGDPFVYTQYHFLDLWKLLSPRYTIYRILKHGLAEIRDYSTDLEIYKIANFLCVRRP